jgi:Fic family protein
MERGRGSDKHPGEFRLSQNWIGGTRPGNAVFVPPPHTFVAQCISDLEKFIHSDSTDLPLLVKSAILHVQFETIHPFLDGNGRVGRLLITLYLCSSGLLREPLLYLSLYFKKHRARYYDLLEVVRKEGDWEAWLEFFLEGVAETAEEAVQTARRLVKLFTTDRSRIEKQGRQTASLLRIHEALKQRPLATLSDAASRSGLSFPSTASAMEALVAMGLVRELTGKKRNRVFTYDKYLAALSEGTEPI